MGGLLGAFTKVGSGLEAKIDKYLQRKKTKLLFITNFGGGQRGLGVIH